VRLILDRGGGKCGVVWIWEELRSVILIRSSAFTILVWSEFTISCLYALRNW